VDILKHSVDYIRTLQRILSEYDDYAEPEQPAGQSDLCSAPSPATPSTCSSPSLYAESGYGSPPLTAHHHAVISPTQLSPVGHSRGDGEGYQLLDSRRTQPGQQHHHSSRLSNQRLSPASQETAQHRLITLAEREESLRMRLSPGGCPGGGAARILQLGQSQLDQYRHHHQQQQQQQRHHNQQQGNSDNGVFPSGHSHPKLEGLADSGLFPGVRPIASLALPSKEYLWQVGTCVVFL
jgi:hypothetical protein